LPSCSALTRLVVHSFCAALCVCVVQGIKLGDLGIAKHFEGTLDFAITCLGTPYYM